MSSNTRILDIVVSATALLVSLPLCAAAALLTWLHDRAWPFYSPERIGREGTPFRLYKIRTMVIDAEKIGSATARTGDPRLTTIGGFLRRTKIDELPQFLNVLKGEMSVVGPRATIAEVIARHDPEAGRAILSVRPGITGLGSIVFSDLDAIMSASVDPFGDYLRLVMPSVGELERLYVEQAAIWVDFALVALTALNFIARTKTLEFVGRLVATLGGGPELVRVAKRHDRIELMVRRSPDACAVQAAPASDV